MRHCFLKVYFCFLVFDLTSQTDSVKPTFDNSYRYIRYTYDNDFFNMTDRYYTQGIQLEYISPIIEKNPVTKLLLRLGNNSQKHFGMSLEQNCFTPRSIRYDTLNTLERPYAATLFLTHSLISIDTEKKRRLTTKLDLGIIGPCAVCEEEQKGIHKALENIAPLGWEHQLKTDVIVNYSAFIEQNFFSGKYFQFIGLGDARLGTIYNDVSGGLMFRAGIMNSYFQNLGVTKNTHVNKFQFYLTAKGKVKLVGYNATIQGGMFTRNMDDLVISSDQVERAVYLFYGSAVLAYKRVSIEYARVFITKEFHRGIEHGWGKCNITVCF